jgi:hypothetical protein
MARASASRSPRHLPQGRLQVDRAAVLAEQIGEGLVGELLEVPHAVPGEQVESVHVS